MRGLSEVETTQIHRALGQFFATLETVPQYQGAEYAVVWTHGAFLLGTPVTARGAAFERPEKLEHLLREGTPPLETLGILVSDISAPVNERILRAPEQFNAVASGIINAIQTYDGRNYDTAVEVYRWLIEYALLQFEDAANILNVFPRHPADGCDGLIRALISREQYDVDDVAAIATVLEFAHLRTPGLNESALLDVASRVVGAFTPQSPMEYLCTTWLTGLIEDDLELLWDSLTTLIQTVSPIILSPIELIRVLRVFQTIERLAIQRKSHWFVTRETQFHLGHVPTEQSHPKTRQLSSVNAVDAAQGVAQIFQVDRDLLEPACRIIESAEFESLVQAIVHVARERKRIRFSGCGSTGRLAAILEIMWRNAWGAQGREYHDVADLVAGIITGGDRALVKSVENFEDFSAFGRRQMADVGIGTGDLCIAISEGGETSSVIGTAWEALDRGAAVYFLFNNPEELLVSSIERSRELIQHPRVQSLDLTTGPMALTGSTRMQATSMEMLILGTALELAVHCVTTGEAMSISHRVLEQFEHVLDQLERTPNLERIGRVVEIETETYTNNGLVTYLADAFLMDVFSDTSERTPTFNLPPMRSIHERDDKPSWAFPKHSRLPTTDAWSAMLLHEPRGLEWTAADYTALRAEQSIIDNPPALAREFLYEYLIGIDDLADRLRTPESITMGISLGIEDGAVVRDALTHHTSQARKTYHLHIGAHNFPEDTEIETLLLPVEIPPTLIHLFEHLILKLVLNAFSTATMAKMGRIQGNFMIYVNPTNKKLVDRGCRIISALGNVDYPEACYELHKTMILPPRLLEDASKVAKTLQRVRFFHKGTIGAT